MDEERREFQERGGAREDDFGKAKSGFEAEE